jgi:hypothetical protein
MTSFASPFSFQMSYCFSPLHSHEILDVAVVVHFSHALLLPCEMCSVRVFLWYFSAEESDSVLVKPYRFPLSVAPALSKLVRTSEIKSPNEAEEFSFFVPTFRCTIKSTMFLRQA